jgi:hypothetical protein
MEIHATQLKAFVPSGPDYAKAHAFFLGLGFKENWSVQGLAELQAGAAVFLLQEYSNLEWQHNQMMYMTVEDLDVFYNDVVASGTFAKFPDAVLEPPKVFPWGVREVIIKDPAGVCWHIRDIKGT